MRTYLYKHILPLTLIGALAALLLSSQVRANESYEEQVQQMYVAYYGRPGDPGGVTYWTGRLAEVGGIWIADLVNAFGTSQEYTDRFGALDSDALIVGLYQQLFNRVPDAGGQAFYVDLLNGTNVTGFNPEGRRSSLAQLALDIANGATGNDRVILNNKVQVAGYFTDLIAESGTPLTPDTIDDAVALLAGIDASEDSVDSGQSAVDTFVSLSGFAAADITLSGEEIVLIGAGYGPSGVALDLYGGRISDIIHIDLSPDGETVWVITQDGNDPVDGGWGFYIMDRSGSNVMRKPLPSMGSFSNRPEVAIADAFGAFGFISVPFSDGNTRHWNVYSTTWHDDTGLLEKLDTLDVADNNPEFPRGAFVNFAPVGLRAVDGVEGFYFLNGDGVYVQNDSSPAKPIRVGWTQDLVWNGDPPPRGSHWDGIDVGGGRWFSGVEIAEDIESAIGGELAGTVFSLEFVAADESESLRSLEMSDDGMTTSYCTFSSADSFNCFVGEYGAVHPAFEPVNPDWKIWRLGLSGDGERVWGQEYSLTGSSWSFVADADGTNAHRAGARLGSYGTSVLDEDGDTLLAVSRYGNGIQFRNGLSLISYRPGLLLGPMPELSDVRYRVTDSEIAVNVAVNENVSSVRAQVFREDYGDPRWFDVADDQYPSWIGGGTSLTRNDDGRYSVSIGISGAPGPNDVLRLIAFNAEGNRVAFVDADLKLTD